MKIVKINVDGEIKIDSIYDTNNQTSQTVNSAFKVPAGNYKNIILAFNFISPSAEQEGLHLFAIFKTEHHERPIEVEITDIEAEGEIYNTSCYLPAEVLQKKGIVELGIYGYILNEDETLKKRISLSPIPHSVVTGSYEENTIDPVVPTPTVFEVYFDKMDQLYEKAINIVNSNIRAVSSIEEMTDTKLIYVNTTDGHWYYHNGTEWTDGGVFQAAEDSKTIENLVVQIEELQKENKNIKDQFPSGEAEGENITLNDSAEMQFKELRIGGNSIQEGEPTPEAPIEIKNITGSANITVCNENLLNLPDTPESTYKGITYSISEQLLKLNGTVASGNYPWIIIVKDKLYFINTTPTANTILNYKNGIIATGVVSKDIKIFEGSTTYNTSLRLYDETGENVTDSLTDDTNICAVAMYLGSEVATYSNYVIGIQLKKGASDYIPHQSQQFTFPLSEGQRMYKDSYLADDGVHHKRGQHIFDGTENWTSGSQIRENFSFVYMNDTVAFNNDNKIIVLSNCLIGDTPTNIIDVGNIGICSRRGTGQGFYMRISKSIATDVSVLKTYLAEQYANGTPLIAEYELANEVIEPYTEEQQLVYNEIKKAHSYKNVTHIFSTDEVKPVLDVTYRKDLETMFNNINNAMLGGN